MNRCPLKPQGRGNLLLSLVDEISGALKLEKVSLLDESKIYCTKKAFSSLWLLHVFKDGRGWYESRGYGQKASSEYSELVTRLRNASISRLESDLNTFQATHAELSSFKETAKTLQNHLMTFKQDQPDAREISEFFTWLWKNRCEDYILIVDQFLPDRLIQHYFEVGSDLAMDFNSLSGWLTKYFR